MCLQVTAEVGADLQLCIAGPDSVHRQLVVHMAPNYTPYTELEDCVRLPDWVPERWKVLTMQVALPEKDQDLPMSRILDGPSFVFHYGSTDSLSFSKVQIAMLLISSKSQDIGKCFQVNFLCLTPPLNGEATGSFSRKTAERLQKMKHSSVL